MESQGSINQDQGPVTGGREPPTQLERGCLWFGLTRLLILQHFPSSRRKPFRRKPGSSGLCPGGISRWHRLAQVASELRAGHFLRWGGPHLEYAPGKRMS